MAPEQAERRRAAITFAEVDGGAKEAARPDHRRSGIALRLVGLCTLIAVRALMWSAYLGTPIPAGQVSDSWLYLGLARGWIAGNPWPLEAAFHSPLYPYLVGLLLQVSGGSIHFLVVIQNLAGILSGMIILEWILRSSSSRASFWIGLLLLVESGPWLALEWRIFPVTFAITAEVVLVELGWQFGRRQAPLAALGAGVATAVLILLRPNFVLAIPLLVVWGIAGLRRRRGFWPLIASATLIPVLCATPLLIRNHEIGAGYTLTASSGITFCHGNNPDAVGGYAPIPGISGEITRQNLDALAVVDPSDPDRVSGADRYWWRKGLTYLASKPGDAAVLLTRKLWLFLSPAEIGGDIEFAFERQRAPLLSLVAGSSFALLLALGIAGLVRRSPADAPRGLLAGLISISFLTCVVFYVTTRYRVPAWPLLVFPASIGLEAVGRWASGLTLQRQELGKLLGAGLAIVGIATLALWSPRPRSEAYWLVDWHNWGVAWEHAGDPKRAVAAYEEVLALDPDHRPTLENLGRVYLHLGNLTEAEAVLEYLVGIHPDSRAGLQDLARLFSRLGRVREAREAEERAAALLLDRN